MSNYNPLVEKWKDALDFKLARNMTAAAELFEEILALHSDWEHGYGHFNLAECYEELGRVTDAKKAYQQALSGSRSDPILLGGYASFLYLYGTPQEAFTEHIKLLATEKNYGWIEAEKQTLIALQALGTKIGLSTADTQRLIESSLAQLSQTEN